MNFIRSFSFTFGTKALSLVLLLIMRILMARLLGPAGLGSFGVALNLTTIISRWGSVGIAPATQFISGKHPDAKNSVFTCTLILSFVLGLANFLLIHFFADELVHWQLGENLSAQQIFRQMYPFIPVIILSMTLPILLLGAGQYRSYSFTQTIPLCIQIALLASGVYGSERIDLVVTAQTFYWLSMVIVAVLLIRLRSVRWHFEGEMISRYIHYSLAMWPLVIFQFGLMKLPVLIGSWYLNNEILGYFLLACNLAEAFFILYNSITPIVFNQTISNQSNAAFLPRSIRFSNILVFLAASLTCLIGKPIFTLLFGNDFNPAWTFLLKLLPWVFVHGMTNILLNYLIASDKQKIVAFIQGSALLMLIITGIILGPHFGANGLCIAMLCSSLTAFLLAFLLIKYRTLQKLELMSLFIPVRQDWLDLRRLIESLK